MTRSLRSWLWRVPLDQDVGEEIAFHIEMRTRELIEKGLDPWIARRELMDTPAKRYWQWRMMMRP